MPPERIPTGDESGRQRLEAIRYVSSLAPVHTLERARSWLRADDGRRVAAQNVVARHAESRDVPKLLGHAEAAGAERDFYGLCSYVDAFARLPDAFPIRLITKIFDHAEYSYARCRADQALAVASGGRRRPSGQKRRRLGQDLNPSLPPGIKQADHVSRIVTRRNTYAVTSSALHGARVR